MLLPLLASEATDANNLSLGHAALTAFVGMAGTMIGLVVGYLKDRDKLRFNTRVQELELKSANNEKEVKECNEDRQVLRAQVQAHIADSKENRRRQDSVLALLLRKLGVDEVNDIPPTTEEKK